MYRELLSELIQEYDGAKLQNPCSEKELAKAEKLVGYPFPDELKALLRETDGDRWFLLSVKEIMERVELNRSILSEDFEPEEYLEKVDRHIFSPPMAAAITIATGCWKAAKWILPEFTFGIMKNLKAAMWPRI